MMRQAYIQIHHALHSDASVVTIAKVDYPILKAGNGCRYVTFEGIQVMQQNPNKTSQYAQRAKAGEKISWAMTAPSWTLIDDAAIKQFTAKTQLDVPIQQLQPGNPTSNQKTGSQANRNRVTRNFWRP